MKKLTKFFSVLLIGCFILAMLPTATVQASSLNKTESQIKADIAKYSVSVLVNGSNQQFSIKKSEISKITIKSTKYNSNKTKATVKSIVYIDRKVATVKGKVTSVYKYSSKKKKWVLSSVEYTSTSISKFKAKGTWSGTYVAGQGETRVSIEIGSVTKDGFFGDGVLSFSATPTNPKVPSGSYSIIGGYDLSTGKVNFSGNEWITRPSGYSMVDFKAYIDLVNKQITGTNYSLVLTKEE